MHHNEEQWSNYFDQLAEQDYVVIDQFLADNILSELLTFFNSIEKRDLLKKAAIGSSGNEKIIQEIRGDFTYWINKNIDKQIDFLFKEIDDLKLLINRYCFLSLSGYEFHLALYPEGSFYKKHLDQFSQRSNRMISIIVYLNEVWQNGDGGELKIYLKDGTSKLIAPYLNRCIMFKSDSLLHEVLKANKPRKSMTGWMLYQPTKLVTLTP